jgi:hypothetical protein
VAERLVAAEEQLLDVAQDVELLGLHLRLQHVDDARARCGVARWLSTELWRGAEAIAAQTSGEAVAGGRGESWRLEAAHQLELLTRR